MQETDVSLKRVLLIAFHYPPVKGSSGLHRTLSFSKHLLKFGWLPLVMTVNDRAHDQTSEDLMDEIPQEVEVVKSFALNAPKIFSFKGKYPGFIASPDKWVSWTIDGVIRGLGIVRTKRTDVIWSTYPIPTAHLIGLILRLLTQKPWIADFRDSMTEENYPRKKWDWILYRWIEGLTVKYCSKAVFTAPGTLSMYRKRYPEFSRKFHTIENGVDESIFATVSRPPTIKTKKNRYLFVHSGLLYRHERDPKCLFKAVAELKAEGIMSSNNSKILLRASGDELYYSALVESLGVEDIIRFEGHIPYRDALSEMISADCLLIFQAASCNHQIPAKIYEYLMIGNPILAFTDHCGDTAGVLRRSGEYRIADLQSVDQIKSVFKNFFSKPPAKGSVDSALLSREARSRELAALLKESCRS